VGFAGHVVDFDSFGPQNVDALFFMLRWDQYRSTKNRVMTRYVELVFLHLVGSVGSHYFSSSGGPGAVSRKIALGHIMPNLSFHIWWDLRVAL
jgi:hypothetical protein